MRSVLDFNQDWLYLPEDADPARPDSDFTPVTLPHTNIVLPHHNFDNHEYQFISTYRKRFTLPEPRNGRRVYIDFDGAMIACTVSLNGHVLGVHEGGYTPFSFDLTDHLNDDGDNLLTVRLDSTERPDIPPYGGVVDYLTFGGIYRDVHLRYVEPVHIADVFVKTREVLNDSPVIDLEIVVRNTSNEPQPITVTAVIVDYTQDTKGLVYPLGVTTFPPNYHNLLEPNSEKIITQNVVPPYDDQMDEEFMPEHTLWSINNPVMYGLGVYVSKNDALVDKYEDRFGFREAEFRDDGFYLNGVKINLIGLNRHQTYPYIGAAAPKRLQEKDADIIKYELGCNIVRTSHYPQSPHFLRRCDEIGLLVFEEIPGWQHSEFLEDVYTFNDFSNTVQEPVQTPHMVTEFNGHMFPTKSYDQEERLVEHALRHARIQDRQMGMDNVCGAIGWCAFDYNTHKEFGSGDRICYHGVMDIFRLPKYAGYFYESQIDPSHHAVLQAATLFARGERSVGGVDPLVVFSNCDEIEVYRGTELQGRYTPDREQFPNLPHPPFVIPGIQMPWGSHDYTDLRLVGFINGKQVAEQQFDHQLLPARLELCVDDTTLNADGADMTRLVFKIVDKYGNRLPFTNQVVSFEIDGPAELVSENPFALIGGQAALYVKAGHEPGQVTVRATTPRLKPSTVTLEIQGKELQ